MTGSRLIAVDGSEEKAPSAANQSVGFDNALVGVDGTSNGRDAIALADLLRADGGRLTLAHVVRTPTPSYQNFHATVAGKESREMLERERQATGVTAS